MSSLKLIFTCRLFSFTGDDQVFFENKQFILCMMIVMQNRWSFMIIHSVFLLIFFFRWISIRLFLGLTLPDGFASLSVVTHKFEFIKNRRTSSEKNGNALDNIRLENFSCNVIFFTLRIHFQSWKIIESDWRSWKIHTTNYICLTYAVDAWLSWWCLMYIE